MNQSFTKTIYRGGFQSTVTFTVSCPVSTLPRNGTTTITVSGSASNTANGQIHNLGVNWPDGTHNERTIWEGSNSSFEYSFVWNGPTMAQRSNGRVSLRIENESSSQETWYDSNYNPVSLPEYVFDIEAAPSPTCSINVQTGSSFYPNGIVRLGLSANGNGSTIGSGVLRTFYKAPNASNYTQINNRTGLTNSYTQVSEDIPATSNGGKIYWDYTISNGSQTVSASTSVYTITSNSAPSTPSTLTVPDSVAAGQSFAISWSASTDPDGNLKGYILERSTDGGARWSTVYQGASRNTTDILNAETERVRYRVKAYDSAGAESSYKYGPSTGDITVSNNHAPTVPASPITITPASLMVGVQAVISWGQSTDEDGDSIEYVLERSVDNLTSYAEIYRGTSRNYTDTVGSWSTVSYRVKAVDSHGASSGYLTAETKVVSTNSAPTITCSHADGEDLGAKSAFFTFTYQVNDENAADTLTIKEIVDGVVKRTYNNAVRNQDYTFEFQTGSAASTSYWNKILNGSHTITISVTDGAVTVSRTFTFLKNVGACLITMAEAIESTRNIEKVALSICGSVPTGGFTAVEVTADDGAHWEPCILASGSGVTESGIGNRKKKATGALTEELLGGHYLFIHTMTNTGKKFNFRIQAEKVGNEGGFISSVQGTFTEASA